MNATSYRVSLAEHFERILLRYQTCNSTNVCMCVCLYISMCAERINSYSCALFERTKFSLIEEFPDSFRSSILRSCLCKRITLQAYTRVYARRITVKEVDKVSYDFVVLLYYELKIALLSSYNVIKGKNTKFFLRK